MEILTRTMRPAEASEVQKMGRRAFGGLEGWGVPKPKQAVVAVRDGKIVGAVQYKFYHAGGKKVGYFDYAFIAPECRSQGIGRILYKATTDYLWEQGCDALTALVKDDNVGSWGLFLKNGFTRISLPELVRQFGLPGSLRLYLGTVFGIANGMDYYVASREQSIPSGKFGSTKQIVLYALTNLLLSLVWLFGRPERIDLMFGAYLLFLAGGVLFGYLGTLFSKREWSFRLCNGGGAVCAFVNLIGGAYPLIGNWYPSVYENSDQFRKSMGIQALSGWIFVLGLTLLTLFAGGQQILMRYINQLGSVFLLYRILALYPFEAFGGGRVYRWNRGIYFLMAAVSLGTYLLNNVR